jgi:hypothetical protein
MINLYDINNSQIIIEEFENSKIFIIDDFYRTPDLVWNKISSNQAELWKSWQRPSYNGKFFADMRHDFEDESFRLVTEFLENVCGQISCAPFSIMTNCLKLFEHPFNDYNNCYWMPHKDLGYNALIYFNQMPEHPGTNLYYDNGLPPAIENEHFKPWIEKTVWKKSITLMAKYNRLVLFDGNKFWHGAAFEDERFFKTTRLNQVCFFQPNR